MFFLSLNVGFSYAKLISPALFSLLEKFGFAWGTPLVLTAALFGGILLVALNRPIIMLYEGYPLQRFRAFRFLTTRQRRQWHKLHHRLEKLLNEYHGLPSGEENPRAIAMQAEITLLRDRANNLFPPEPESVLPTRLGNAIRAFESYAQERYSIEPITLWSRLLPVLPPEFLNKVKDARTSFNFMINTVLVLQLFGLELLVMVIFNKSLWLFLGAFANLVISYLLYRAAVPLAVDWGYMFNTAFDLYRRDLLKQFGFRSPRKLEEERKLWDKIWYFIFWNKDGGLDFNGESLEDTGEVSTSPRGDKS